MPEIVISTGKRRNFKRADFLKMVKNDVRNDDHIIFLKIS